MYQNLIWFVSHPKVCFVHLINSEVGKLEVFERLGMIYAMITIGSLGFIDILGGRNFILLIFQAPQMIFFFFQKKN